MDKEIFKKGELLHTKLETLIYSRNRLAKATAITDITIETGKFFKYQLTVRAEYIDFNRFKAFLLEEMDKEIAKIQKEFDEL